MDNRDRLIERIEQAEDRFLRITAGGAASPLQSTDLTMRQLKVLLILSFADGSAGELAAEADGDGFRLRGRVLAVNGDAADQLLAAASGPGGPVVLVVDPEGPGVSRRLDEAGCRPPRDRGRGVPGVCATGRSVECRRREHAAHPARR